MSLVLLDIDYFKTVNDRHGHPTGDLVLQALTIICITSLRKSDVFARLGGEEFAILLPNTTIDEALALANMLRETLETTMINIPGNEISIFASFGCSTACIECYDVDSMVKLADELLWPNARVVTGSAVNWMFLHPHKERSNEASHQISNRNDFPIIVI